MTKAQDLKKPRAPAQDKAKDQGAKTRDKNREIVKGGSPDQGTQ